MSRTNTPRAWRRGTARTVLLGERLERRGMLSGSASFAYFLDTMTDGNVALTMPESGTSAVITAVLGEASAVQRSRWTTDWTNDTGTPVAARIVGESMALNDSAPGRNLWPVIGGLFPSADPVPDAAKHDLAVAILKAVMADTAAEPGKAGSEFPLAAEAVPTASGGYVMWTQDFEFAPGESSTNEVYAGITAVLWAGRQLLTEQRLAGNPALKIVPVPSSSIFKTLGDSKKGYLDTEAILKGVPGTPYLASLGLSPLPRTNTVTATNPNGEWNFLSTLAANGLIDGFLGQQYSINNADAIPGSISSDTLAFYPGQSLPYAIMSAHDNPSQLTASQPNISQPPWPSWTGGSLPFQAGIYWYQDEIDPLPQSVGGAGFDPSAYLLPQTHLLGLQADRDAIVDFNADGIEDLVWIDHVTGRTIAVLQDVSGTAVGRRFLGGDQEWMVEATGDFDGNGATDIVWRHTTGIHVQWLLRDDGSVGGRATLEASPMDRVASIADFNGDGKADLAWRDNLSGQTVVWVMDGDRVLSRAREGGDSSWRLVRLSQRFDANGDGRADLLWRDASSGLTVAWMMEGTRVIASANLGGDAQWIADAVGDFDGDGRSDVVWRHMGRGTAVARTASGDRMLGGSADWSIVAVRDGRLGGRVEVAWRQASTGYVVGRTLDDGAVTGARVLGGGGTWTPAGIVAAPAPNLVLWHEGYKTNLGTLFQADAWTAYTDAIVEFATSHGVGTVMTSLIFGTDTDTLPADAVGFLSSFVAAVEKAGLTAGVSIAFGSETTFEQAATTLAGIPHVRPLLLGLDAENFAGTAIPVPKASTVMTDVVVPFAAALTEAKVSFSQIAVIGGMAFDSSWAAPLSSVYEYYSDANGVLNPLFAGDVNDPARAWTDFIAATTHSGGDVVNPSTIGGWPAFAISRADADCLGGCTADPDKKYPCGIADIFGTWSWESFASFVGQYQSAYAPRAIVIYQGDQLPCGWLGGGCSSGDAT